MKAKTTFIVIILLTLSCFVSAQDKKDRFGIIIKQAPTSLLTPETPTFQIGVELLPPAFRKHGLSAEIDYGFRCAIIGHYPKLGNGSKGDRTTDPTNIYDKHYSKYRLEIRKYFKPAFKKLTIYLAAEGFHIPYSFNEKDGQFISASGNWYGFSSAHVNKDVKGAALKCGLIAKLTPHFYIEGFAGLGVRWETRTYSEFIGRDNSPQDYPDNIEGLTRKEHVALGVKIGYKLQW